MKIIVNGATGATGICLVKELLDQGHHVKAFVRSPDKLKELKHYPNLEVIEANVLELAPEDLQRHAADCDAVASCLGHNMSWKGIYGHPRKLVTDTAASWCSAIAANQNAQPVKYVLMNTAGNSNRDLDEPISFAQRMLLGLIRLLLPPHVDNEHAADYLRTEVGQHNQYIQWAVVRPDNLTDEAAVSPYQEFESPTRNALFNPGKTSRMNVANFMARLITDPNAWEKWQGKMPVIYNTEAEENRS